MANSIELCSEIFIQVWGEQFKASVHFADREIEDIAKIPYAVGCLMHAMTCTHPNLAHVASQVSKYMSNQERNIGKQLSNNIIIFHGAC